MVQYKPAGWWMCLSLAKKCPVTRCLDCFLILASLWYDFCHAGVPVLWLCQQQLPVKCFLWFTKYLLKIFFSLKHTLRNACSAVAHKIYSPLYLDLGFSINIMSLKWISVYNQNKIFLISGHSYKKHQFS